MDDRLEVAAARWAVRQEAAHSRWWSHPRIVRHVNRLVCGEPIDGPHAGFNRLIQQAAPSGGFGHAISVGCGSGGKEMKLLQQGIVQHFHLCEIGEHRREQIFAKAGDHGVADRVTVHIGNALDRPPDRAFDLIYWNNALHHMFDARAALLWSKAGLSVGGVLAMDDFVGPTRFQWTEAELDLAARVRTLLPDRFLPHPHNQQVMIPRRPKRPTIEEMLAADPTEAADSEAILDALMEIFPKAEIVPTGGVVYHLALNDVLANFRVGEDDSLLDALLLLDETLAGQGHSHYAVALGRAS
ncbi:MAG: class I SAM-dependent methyltransferase [Alphaproteobacteria bacterium]